MADALKTSPTDKNHASLTSDENRLTELGYNQELKRNFSLAGIVAFSYSIVTSWTALAGVLIVGTQSGGPPVMIWSWIGVCLLTLTVAYSLAEMCSAYPVAGGQYSWVAVFAPRRLRRGMSYLCGWFLLIGMLAMGATTNFVSANFLLGLANLNNRGFVIERWHTVLTAWAVVLGALIYNVFLTRLLSKTGQGFLILNISVFVIVVATILAMNDNLNSPSFVFSDFVNLTGFSDSYTAILGILQAAYGMCCYDSASRLVEEVKDARKQAPRAIVMAVYIGFFTGFVFLIAATFCMGPVEEMAATSTGVPAIEIFFHSGGRAAATALASLKLIVGFGASIGLTATGGRVVFAFARDHGLPFSGFLSKVHAKSATPVNALCAAAAVQAALIAIYFGASQGFETVISMATQGFYLSYAMPLIARLMSLWTDQPAKTIPGLYSLGRWSIPFNVVGVVYLLFTTITFNFPTRYPVTHENMNYTSAATGVVMLIALVTWITTGNKHFRGPVSGGVAVGFEGQVQNDGASSDEALEEEEKKTVA